MKVDKEKLYLAMAKACMNISDVAKKASMPIPTVKNVVIGRNVRPATLGKVCRALDVEVDEILMREQ